MDRLQNRVAFGDDVLGQLGEAPEAVKEEASAFEEKHAALRSAASDASAADAERDPPAALIEAWDAALRRLIDRMRAEAPARVGDILAPKRANEASKPTARSSPAPKREPKAKSRAKAKAEPKPGAKEKAKPKAKAKPPAANPTPTLDASAKPEAKPKEEAREKPAGKKKATVRPRRGR